MSFLFGSSDVANGITEFINLVQRLGALHDTETGIPISSAELLRGLTAWVQIQKCTEAEYKSIMWDPVMTCIASCSKESVKFTPSDENRALETIELISNIKHHVLYAGASYGDTGIAFMWSKLPFSSNSLWLSHRNHHAFAEHTKSSVDDVYHTSYANHIDHSVYHPKFYIVLDHEKRNVGMYYM